ncbi:MAG: Gfo/Idh/MocA family protein [Propionibacteriaceae bacterium]
MPEDLSPTRLADTGAPLTRIRWGVLGCGHIAGVFASDLALLPEEAELVAAASHTSAEKAEKFAADFGFARGYGSFAELAADPDIDVVYVATPHNDHLSSARLCLEAGKAVLIEKPMTVSEAEAIEVFDLAREANLFCMEAVWMRTNPLVRKAAALAAAGEIGEIRHVSATFGFLFDGDDDHRLLNPDLAGGALLDLGVYPVHAVELYLGEPDEVVGVGSLASTGVDAHLAAVLGFGAVDNRRPATATVVCTLEADVNNRLEVFGTNGRIEMDFLIKPDEVRVYRGHGQDAKPDVLVTELPGGGYTLQAQEVMRCLRSGEIESPLVPWSATLGSLRTLARWRTAALGPDTAGSS